jgi:hypothetical protein
MTVNELIEKLKEYGDEKDRDLAIVRIVNQDGAVLEDNIDIFDVKFGIRSVDIPIVGFTTPICPCDDDWDDDRDWDEVDDEDDPDEIPEQE